MNRATAHRASLPLWCVVLLLPSLAWGQAELRSGKKGATNPAPVTSTSIDADHQALDVNVAGGTLGNVTISNADGAINDGVSNTIKATVLDLTNSNPVTTAIVDSSGNQITSFGGGTQYQQGDASTATDTMTMAGCVRVDTPAVAAGVIDGDRARCMVDSTGRLWVHVGVIDGTVGVTQSGTWNIATLTSITNPVAVTGTFWQATQPVSGTVTANAGSGNFTVVQSTGTNLHVVCDSGCSSSAGFADNSAFTFGTTAINPIGGVLDDTSTNTATENSAAVARITAQKALHMNLRNNSGTEIGTSGAPIRTDPTGSTTQPVSAASLPLPTGAATAANQDGIIKDGTGDTTQANVVGGRLQVENYNANLAADNSTLSTSKVPVLPGTVSTSAPTWTNGNQSALSLQTDGSVRAAVTNSVTVTQGTGTNLHVVCDSGCSGSGGTSMVDDAAFTPATTAITPAGFMFDDVSPDSVNEGDGGVARMSANRNIYTTIRDAAGNERGVNVNASNELQVAATGTVTANAGTNLNTSALLTTTAHDAAFGTAGTPDAQVRSVQGIASGTPVGVQSNGANLATEASVDGLEGGLGAAADAAATAGSTGSVTAKLRLMTSQLDTISTNVASLLTSSQLVDDDQTGASLHHRVSVGTTEDEHEVKGSAGRLFSISVTNTNAAVRYLRCANQVAASTTPGTTTVFYGMAIPGATTGAGFTVNFGPMGIAFSTGLTCWLVTGAAETDVAEVAANEINVNYTYK